MYIVADKKPHIHGILMTDTVSVEYKTTFM